MDEMCLIPTESALKLALKFEDWTLNDTSIPTVIKAMHCYAKGKVFCPSTQRLGFCASESDIESSKSISMYEDTVSCMCFGLKNCIKNSACSTNLYIFLGILFMSLVTFMVKRYPIHKHASNFQMFDLVSSWKRLFHPSSSSCLPCLDGVRCVALICVMLGHMRQVLSNLYTVPPEIHNDGKQYSIFSMFILHNMDLAVDAFLLLGGLLNARTWIKDSRKTKSARFWSKYFVLRWLRLAPPVLFALIIERVISHLVVAEMYMGASRTDLSCKYTWWSLPLFINNYVPNECARWTWYIGLDMQLHVLSPLLLILLQSNRAVLGVLLSLIACAASFIQRSQMIIDLNVPILHSADAPVHDATMQILYAKASPRLFPYILGLLIGSFLPRWIEFVSKFRKANLFGGTVSFLLFAWSIFGPFPEYYLGVQASSHKLIYLTFFRGAFSVAVAWLILMCISGKLVFLNSFFSNFFFTFLSRISYTFYLVHTMVFGVIIQYFLYKFIPFTVNIDYTLVALFPVTFLSVVLCSTVFHVMLDGCVTVLREHALSLLDYKYKLL